MRTTRLLRGLVAPLLVACGDFAGAADLPAIQDRGTLRVIFGPDMRRETFSAKPGEPPGMEREMIEGFAAMKGLKVELVTVAGGPDRIRALLAEKGDLAVGLGITEERRKTVAFTSVIFPTRHLVVTRQPHTAVRTLEQLRSVRVGTVKGSSWATSLATAKVPSAKVDSSFSSPEDILEGLRKRQVEAIVMPVDWALLEMRNDPQLELGLYVGQPVGRAWAIRKESSQLLKAIDDYLANVRRSGSWSRLVVKYYGELTLEALQKSRADF